MLNRRLMRPSMAMTGTCASASFAVMFARSSSIIPSVARRRLSTRERRASKAFGSRYLNASSSSSFFTLLIPRRLAIGRVDVARLLRDLDPALLGKMMERPHVVEAVGELDEDDADVVHHRQQHLPEILRLPLLARRERNRAQLGHPLDHVGDVGAEELLDSLDRRLRVLDDVVQEPGRDGHDVQLHVGELVGYLQRVHEIGFTGVPDLALVLERGKHIGAPEQLNVSLGVICPNFFDEVLEPDHVFGV